MEEKKKYAYFYDRKSKMEALGPIMQVNNWGSPKTDAEEAARKVLPKRIERFHILKVERKELFGSFLSDILLSSNFEVLITYMQDEITKLDPINFTRFPEDVRLFLQWGEMLSWNDSEEDVRQLYMIRKFIELCVESPKLYSFGQFQRLLWLIDRQAWHPQTLGLFGSAEVPNGQYLFDCGERLYWDAFFKDDYSSNYKRDYKDYLRKNGKLSELDHYLRLAFPDQNKINLLPLPVMEVFRITSVVDLVLLSLFHLLQEQTGIKICANCNKLFVPLARSDAIYCDKPAPQDREKTCKEYASKVQWYENIKADDVAKLARNVYCAKQMLAKRNPDNPEYESMFEYFKNEKKKWEQQVKKGAKTREDFMEWLEMMKLCRTLAELEKS